MLLQITLVFVLFNFSDAKLALNSQPPNYPQSSALCLQKYFEIYFNSNSDMPRYLTLIHRPAAIDEELEENFYAKSNENIEWKIVVWRVDELLRNITEELNQSLNSVIFLRLQDLSDLSSFKNIRSSLNTFIHIILTGSEELDDSEFNEAIRILMNYFESKTNIITLRKNKENSFIWKMLKFIRQNCSWTSFEAVTFEECSISGNISDIEYKSIKDAESKECSIYVSGINQNPYTYYDRIKGFYKGIDYHLVRFIAHRLNKPLEFYYMNGSEFENFSAALLSQTEFQRLPILRLVEVL